LNKNVSALA